MFQKPFSPAFSMNIRNGGIIVSRLVLAAARKVIGQLPPRTSHEACGAFEHRACHRGAVRIIQGQLQEDLLSNGSRT